MLISDELIHQSIISNGLNLNLNLSLSLSLSLNLSLSLSLNLNLNFVLYLKESVVGQPLRYDVGSVEEFTIGMLQPDTIYSVQVLKIAEDHSSAA